MPDIQEDIDAIAEVTPAFPDGECDEECIKEEAPRNDQVIDEWRERYPSLDIYAYNDGELIVKGCGDAVSAFMKNEDVTRGYKTPLRTGPELAMCATAKWQF
jgi:hypothetical protein